MHRDDANAVAGMNDAEILARHPFYRRAMKHIATSTKAPTQVSQRTQSCLSYQQSLSTSDDDTPFEMAPCTSMQDSYGGMK